MATRASAASVEPAGTYVRQRARSYGQAVCRAASALRFQPKFVGVDVQVLEGGTSVSVARSRRRRLR